MYDYKNGKRNVIDILNSKTKVIELDNIPDSEEKFTYENGISAWVGALFIDIKDSSKLFATDQERVARIMRAFTSEIIEILKSDSNYRQIGIRGDCVYGIYNACTKENLVKIFRLAYCINTFMNMLNKLLSQNNFAEITAGIGLGCNHHDLIIKAGKSGTGISDKIWLGKAVVNAANLSGEANRNGNEAIAMDNLFYDNIIEILKKENSNYSTWIKKKSDYYGSILFYHCNIVQKDFDNWIEEGM